MGSVLGPDRVSEQLDYGFISAIATSNYGTAPQDSVGPAIWRQPTTALATTRLFREERAMPTHCWRRRTKYGRRRGHAEFLRYYHMRVFCFRRIDSVTGFSMSIRPSPGLVQSERRTDAEDGVENGSLCLACVFTPSVRERDGSTSTERYKII